MSHRLISMEDAEEMVASFSQEHDHHTGSDWHAGEWGLVISCPACRVFETAAIQNDAYKRARGDLKEQGVVTF